jgi:hypothetical protein
MGSLASLAGEPWLRSLKQARLIETGKDLVALLVRTTQMENTRKILDYLEAQKDEEGTLVYFDSEQMEALIKALKRYNDFMDSDIFNYGGTD